MKSNEIECTCSPTEWDRVDDLSCNLIYLHIFPYLQVNQQPNTENIRKSNDVDGMLAALFPRCLCVLSLIDTSLLVIIPHLNLSFGIFICAYQTGSILFL